MSSPQPPSRRIRILREEVARRIAAGEVIDRPHSVLRELLDNAVDAGAAAVEVGVEAGGTRRIRVVDDGCGMSREDLELCALRHATSKIVEDEDLYRVSTLGFRGEALASIGACARLQIVSFPEGAASAWRLVVEGGRRLRLEACEGRRGTAVEAADLFFNLPARRKFLKAQSAEAALCRQTFLEKALPHPDVSFRYLADGALKTFLPAAGLVERVAAATGLPAEHLALLEAAPAAAPPGGGSVPFRLRVVAARPEAGRPDRRLLQVYVNRRRVQEFAFIQAMEYAYSEHLSGGRYPAAFLFLEVDPAWADFNIHPAKREVRLRGLPEMRQALVGLLKGWLAGFGLRAGGTGGAGEAGAAGGQTSGGPVSGVGVPGGGAGGAPRGPLAAPLFPPSQASGARPYRAPFPPAAGPPPPAAPTPAGVPLYRGRVFGLFLLAELDDRLFLVDAHAAHERLLYEELRARPPRPQELLFPLRLEVSRDEGRRLLSRRASLEAELGLRLEPDGEDPDHLQVSALPEELLAVPEGELAEALLGGQGSPEELREALYRLAACRLAVKDGDPLDPLAAQKLIADVFPLPNARCPHGRPIWTVVRREDLLRAVGRPVPGEP